MRDRPAARPGHCFPHVLRRIPRAAPLRLYRDRNVGNADSLATSGRASGGWATVRDCASRYTQDWKVAGRDAYQPSDLLTRSVEVRETSATRTTSETRELHPLLGRWQQDEQRLPGYGVPPAQVPNGL